MPILGGHIGGGEVAAQVSLWEGMGLTWSAGHDVFDLTDIGAGIMLKRGGVRGLSMPPYTRYSDQGPAVAGSRNRGSTVNERPVFWPLCIWSDISSQEFIDRDAAFWKTMRPDSTGIWAVTQPSGEVRRLTCRYVDDSDQAFDQDPIKYGWAIYGLTLVAEQPFWVGDPIVRNFVAPDPVPFFATGGAVFNITPGGTTDSAFIPNPGDVDSWAVWTVTGPVDGATIGAGAGSIDIPFALAGGEFVIVDTNPDNQGVIDQDGVDRIGDVTWDPRPVPPGSEVELDITLDSPDPGASVKVELEPLFYRAWG